LLASLIIRLLFASLICLPHHQNTEMLFRFIDTDGSGEISSKELSKLLRNGVPMEADEEKVSAL